MKGEWVVQHDNDPKHMAKSTKKCFEDKKVKVLPWPSQSPDLNIIAVHDRRPRTLQELECVCPEEWSKITKERIQKLVKGYKKRLEEVIEAKGGNTHY